MRCPNCNQWNRASLPRCTRCGTELAPAPVEPSWRSQLTNSKAKAYIHVDEDGQADVSPDRRDELAAQMTELKARKDEGLQIKQQLMADLLTSVPPASSQPVTENPFAMEEEEGVEAAPEAVPQEPMLPERSRKTARVAIHGLRESSQTASYATGNVASVRRAILTPGQWTDSRTYDPVVEEMQRQQNVFRTAPQMTSQPAPRGRSRRMSVRRFINFLTLLLAGVVLVLAGAVGYSAWQQYQAAQADKSQALVSASMKDDQAAHTILIPGEEGQMIYIRELHTKLPVVGGFATFVIPDHEWYDEMDVVTEETMTVTLTPSIQSSGARQKTLEPITYDITIPLSPIEMVSPEEEHTEVTTAMYSLILNVRTGSTVTINGTDMSDAVDENGQLVYNATVHAQGDNVYTVNVRSPYCRDNTMDIVLYRAAQKIPLDLDPTTYTTTNLEKYQISCTTLPGATVDILTPHSDLNITELAEYGRFSFYAIFDKIGNNTVTIRASRGEDVSTVDHVIYYVPNVDVYTRKAWPLSTSSDYAELMGNIEVRSQRSQVYVAMGTIDSFVSESPQMAIVYCSENGQSQPVLLENRTKTTWKEGQYYRIYADAFGTYNGMPWLIARYCYLD